MVIMNFCAGQNEQVAGVDILANIDRHLSRLHATLHFQFKSYKLNKSCSYNGYDKMLDMLI